MMCDVCEMALAALEEVLDKNVRDFRDDVRAGVLDTTDPFTDYPVIAQLASRLVGDPDAIDALSKRTGMTAEECGVLMGMVEGE